MYACEVTKDEVTGRPCRTDAVEVAVLVYPNGVRESKRCCPRHKAAIEAASAEAERKLAERANAERKLADRANARQRASDDLAARSNLRPPPGRPTDQPNHPRPTMANDKPKLPPLPEQIESKPRPAKKPVRQAPPSAKAVVPAGERPPTVDVVATAEWLNWQIADRDRTIEGYRADTAEAQRRFAALTEELRAAKQTAADVMAERDLIAKERDSIARSLDGREQLEIDYEDVSADRRRAHAILDEAGASLAPTIAARVEAFVGSAKKDRAALDTAVEAMSRLRADAAELDALVAHLRTPGADPSTLSDLTRDALAAFVMNSHPAAGRATAPNGIDGERLLATAKYAAGRLFDQVGLWAEDGMAPTVMVVDALRALTLGQVPK